MLPATREDFRLPPELYAFRLKQVGIDIDPQLLIQRAQVEYMETRAAMQALAPVVKPGGVEPSDYRTVISSMKKDVIPNDQLGRAKEINTALEAIRRERVVDVPNRPMIMRLASAAESAAQPAHLSAAPADRQCRRAGAVRSPGWQSSSWRQARGLRRLQLSRRA